MGPDGTILVLPPSDRAEAMAQFERAEAERAAMPEVQPRPKGFGALVAALR